MKMSPVKHNAKHTLAALAPSRLFIRSRFCAGLKALNLKANFNFSCCLHSLTNFRAKIASIGEVILGRVMRRRSIFKLHRAARRNFMD
ncbi:hypothetical protein [uncultured Campylobacter sp.]|uniref:hypothetical protein n=1 Tax=uncultured Campylobacter sp. TaxID=218934 RepID=UPI0026146ED2|nr:hypothetical protein [uncultured Campylobacter sp.]